MGAMEMSQELQAIGNETGLHVDAVPEGCIRDSRMRESLIRALENSNLYASQAGCSGAEDGTWLILKGGPRLRGAGRWVPGDFVLTRSSREVVMQRGELTIESRECYDADETQELQAVTYTKDSRRKYKSIEYH